MIRPFGAVRRRFEIEIYRNDFGYVFKALANFRDFFPAISIIYYVFRPQFFRRTQKPDENLRPTIEKNRWKIYFFNENTVRLRIALDPLSKRMWRAYIWFSNVFVRMAKRQFEITFLYVHCSTNTGGTNKFLPSGISMNHCHVIRNIIRHSLTLRS